jgi:hypothetical protein
MSADQSSTPNSELGVEKLAAALRERDDALAEVAEHWIERERLENLTDVAEHNLHEAVADLKERDAGIERLRRQRNEARATIERVRALAETWTEWGDLTASEMLRNAVEGKT